MAILPDFIRGWTRVMRATLVLLSCCVGMGLATAGLSTALYGWNDQSFTSLKLAARLEMPVEVSFDDVPLRTAVENLCTQANIDVAWDEPALVEAGFSSEETVAFSTSQKISLGKALELVLEPCYLTYELQGERQLLITSRQKWNERVVSTTYDVQDLTINSRNATRLPDIVRKNISSDSWQTSAPTATGYLALTNDQLQVTQPRNVQQQVAALLAHLRANAAAE